MNPITQSDTMRFFALGWSGDRIKPESVIGMARIRMGSKTPAEVYYGEHEMLLAA